MCGMAVQRAWQRLWKQDCRRGWDFLLYFTILHGFFSNIWKCRLTGGDHVQEVRPGSRLLITVAKTEFCQCETTVFSKLNSMGPV